ncbi:MAG: hypothetical protein HY303_18055 [Candidatus Wallbacteria bacterium]|nr:hypothetical protein [Candidatus Wallbacteria bacterium]
MKRAGATLIEVLVAALVLAVAAVPLLTTIQTGSREASESEAVMFAESLATRAMERALARGFRDLTKNAPSVEKSEGLPEHAEGTAGLAAYEARLRGPLSFRTEVRVSRPGNGLVAVESVVTWGKVRGAGDHRLAVARFLAQDDLSLELRYSTGESH